MHHYYQLLQLIVMCVESDKNAENFEAITTHVNHSLDTWLFES